MSPRPPVIQRPIRPRPSPHRSRAPAAVRRLVTFLVLVGVGVGSLLLFSDNPRPARGTSRREVPNNPGVVAGETGTTVVLGVMDFDITTVVEVEPHRFERRVKYVVRFEQGQPEKDGFFQLKEPQITVMNPLTQTVRGEISARAGRCRTNQSSAGTASLSTSNVSVEAFSLSGEVAGRYLMDDGREITLQAEQLDQAGDQLWAPGLVTWKRQGLSLQGRDMSWDQSTGKLDFAANAVITMTSAGGGPAGTLTGAGGLSWEQRSRGRQRPGAPVDKGMGFGSLRGPVTGELSDGSTLSAELLSLDGDATSLTLTGRAHLEQLFPEGTRRAFAEHITVARAESGKLSLAHAAGNVRLEQFESGAETSWLETDSLTEIDGLLSAEGLVRWGRGELIFSGRGLTLDKATRRLRYASDVTMEVPGSSPSALAGMTFRSPGGMVWLVPEEAVDPWLEALGRFTGAVSGETAEGLKFRGDSLIYDGLGELLLLEGAVQAEQLGPDGQLRTLNARRLDLALDQGRTPADLDARGDVLIRWSGQPAGPDNPTPGWSLAAERLQLRDDRVTAPGEVTMTGDALSLTGVGLDYDAVRGHLELAEAVVVRLADGGLIHSPGGLVWDQPDDPALGLDKGTGTLRGPASGEHPQGLTFRSDVVELDGGRGRIALVGDAQVQLPAERMIRAPRIDLLTTEHGQRILSEDEVSWQGPLSRGSGQGLSYDTARRLLTFTRDVAITFLDLTGESQLQLNCQGSLRWQGPQDETLPLWFGSGELLDTVVALTAEGRRLSTDQLLLDGSTGRFDLLGPSRVVLPKISGLGELSARERITLLQNVRGEIVWIDAYGDVTGTVGSSDESFEYNSESLLFDRDASAVVLDGSSRIERLRNGKTVGLRGDPRTRLVAVFDSLGTLTSLAGEGRITSNMGSFTILSDSLNWDVPEDHMELTGNCRVLRFGGEIETSMVEVWPRAWRWHVHPPAAESDDG